jgi:hypothetical protein
MTESDARTVLLIRAFESTPSAAWSPDDSAWASAEARRVDGENVAFEQFLVRRAHLARARLDQRDVKTGAATAPFGAHAGLGWAAILLAFVLGVASDAIGPSQRINILAPPLLALLAWNLIVYLALLLRLDAAPGPLRRLALRAVHALPVDSAVARFVPDWLRASGALQAARIASVLHAAAAALVIGALASLYLRGIAFEFRAGWDSTFLTPAAVHAVLEVVLGPAALLSGIPLPGADRLAQLRFSAGNGENAAPWIHLYAITLGLAVVLPRMLLAALATLRARGLAQDFPLALDDDYFVRLRRTFSGERIDALVLPYSYRPPDGAEQRLRAALDRIAGPNIALTLMAPLPQGAEDDLPRGLGDSPPARVMVALFAATATPELETHGAFVRALAAHASARRLFVLVDEAEFRRRFTGAEGARRLDERRAAWSRLLAGQDIAPVFVDLGAPA